jgi:hypothetical protein
MRMHIIAAMHRDTMSLVFAVICGLLLLGTPAAAQSFNVTSIDVPCAGCPGQVARSTGAQGINPAGDIVGAYVDAVGAQHGFLLRGGQFTTIDVPGALAGVVGTLPTVARGISPSGDIVGSFTAPYNPPYSSTMVGYDSPAYCSGATSVACIKGFLYSGGQFSAVLIPGHPGAIAQRITPQGDIYGCLHDFLLMADMTGFLRTKFGGYITLKADGGELADPSQSVADSMNNGATPDGHTIVGGWTDLTVGHTHGYVVQNGQFQSYDVPGSASTFAWDINPTGSFVGVYHSDRNHGFVQPSGGSAPITIDPPNSVATTAFGINPGGSIVGQYTDTSGHMHGFLAVPTKPLKR